LHAQVYMIFSLHHFYMILQLAGLGYLIGVSTLVSNATAYKSPSGKFNFLLHCNKSVVVFDSIKTHVVGGYNEIHSQTGQRKIASRPSRFTATE